VNTNTITFALTHGYVKLKYFTYEYSPVKLSSLDLQQILSVNIKVCTIYTCLYLWFLHAYETR